MAWVFICLLGTIILYLEASSVGRWYRSFWKIDCSFIFLNHWMFHLCANLLIRHAKVELTADMVQAYYLILCAISYRLCCCWKKNFFHKVLCKEKYCITLLRELSLGQFCLKRNVWKFLYSFNKTDPRNLCSFKETFALASHKK
jgi:hypothetical protein